MKDRVDRFGRSDRFGSHYYNTQHKRANIFIFLLRAYIIYTF